MSEPTFYHGTRRPFSRNGFLVPRAFHQGDPTAAPTKPGMHARADAAEHIYFTTSEELAWVYAWHAAGRGKPKVLVVQPGGPIERDPEHSADMEAYRSRDWARVIEVRREPLIDEYEAAAGWVA